MSLDKLKVAARQHEQRGELREAIDLYRQAIHKAEPGEHGIDPSLYNKIGDLEERAGNVRAACDAWEQAAARYGEQSYFNNGIALCRKILRLDPSHGRSYLDLARFHARKRVLHDVRENLHEYWKFMQHQGGSDQAVQELERLAAEFPGWRDLTRTINDLLGREVEPEIAPQVSVNERSGGLVFLDTHVEKRPTLPPINTATTAGAGENDIGLEPTVVVGADLQANATALEGLERASTDLGELPDAADSDAAVVGLTGFEVTAEAVGETARLAGLEGAAIDADVSSEAARDAVTLDGFEATGAQTSGLTAEPTEDVGLEPVGSPAADGIVFLDTTAPAAPRTPPPAHAAEEGDSPAEGQVQEGGADEESPLAVRADAHQRLEQGDRQGAVEALERSMSGYLEAEQFDRAFQVATELIEAQPAAIDRHQARVEIAARMRDPARLCTSYMDLADALVRLHAEEKAIAVYRRVLEIDESHAAAKAALRRMVPDAAPEVTAEGFIDFGAMVNDEVGPRSSRMRTETTTISDDEDETFREALAEFKRALDQNIAVEDHQAHYDLGLAFKEMGLLDEAIGELQKALRSNEGRLRTSEALGQCFFEQGRPAVAEAVLRSVEKGEESDAEKVGVLYWLGRALEAQGKTKNARTCYERVLAIDISFHDVADRIGTLTDGAG